MRQIDFQDGFANASAPILGNLEASALGSFASDAAFIAAKANPIAVIGDVYLRTSDNVIRYYDGTAWHTVLDATTPLDEARGGTGQGAYVAGDLLYSPALNTLGRLGIGSDGQVLTVVAGIPQWDVGGGGGGGGGSFDVDSIVCDLSGDVVVNNSGNVVTDNSGAAGTSSSGQIIKSMKNATGSTIAIYKAVAWNDDGTISPADANLTSISDVAGITKEAILDNTFGMVCKGGLLPGALTGLGALPGQTVYLSATPGSFSLVPGTDPGVAIGDSWVRVGYAEPADGVASATADDLMINIELETSF